MTSDAKALQTELSTTTSEKESVMKDLEALKTRYDAAIAENTSMSDELIAEREKIVNLMADLKKSKGDVASMSKYKSQYFDCTSSIFFFFVFGSNISTNFEWTEIKLRQLPNIVAHTIVKQAKCRNAQHPRPVDRCE